MAEPPATHPFVQRPNRTLLVLSVPTLVSLVAEPLTGLVDTAFVASIGASALAALGVGTIILSSVFWIFNFLSIGVQTEVAHTYGSADKTRRAELISMALVLALISGVVLILIGRPFASSVALAMGANDEVHTLSVTYIQIRLLGAPAVLLTMVVFGAMRGVQDMQTPLWIAVGVNVLNIILDWVLIFGKGIFPEMGIDGAAWASVISQWGGLFFALGILYRTEGFTTRLKGKDVNRLLVIGGDLFVRTGLLTAFLLLATRAATQMGSESGAAHQAIRQFWTFSALLLDAFAVTGQSLVGYFVGSSNLNQALRVARFVCWWSLGTGIVLTGTMIAGESIVIRLLVPLSAAGVFSSAWYIAALFQPLNALSFATDGIHWGTGDFRYLRNAVIVASLFGAIALAFVDTSQEASFSLIWWITGGWICVRAILGVIRIWPGIGASPFSVSRM